MSQATTAPRITRDDIEAKFRSIHTGVTNTKDEVKKGPIVAGGIATLLLVLLVVFLMGKRKGSIRSTIVEIRRAA
jgi:chaperonin GroEL (HSP60 family)